MPAKETAGSPFPKDLDLSAVPPEALRDLVLSSLELDVSSGVLRLLGHRYGFFRPIVLVNIQKQLEQTVGASTKGFLYLAGEKTAEGGLGMTGEVLAGFDSGSMTIDSFKRLADALAILGCGRFSLDVSDIPAGHFTFNLENSPIAEAYGPSKKPVCHLLAGFLGGVAERFVGREILCEEVACQAQGQPRCRFELRPTPRL